VGNARLSYYMGQTTITITGTVTFHYDHRGVLKNFDRTAFVSTGVGADTSVVTGAGADTSREPYELVLTRKKLFRGDTEIDVSLAPDGRLLGAGFEANGGGADVAGGVVAVLTLSATVLTAAGAAAGEVLETAADRSTEQDQAPRPADPGDGSESWGELSDRAEIARQLALDLQSRAFELARQATGKAPPTGLTDQIKTVSTSLDLARAEAANLRQALKAWQSKHYPDRSASFTCRFGLDDLERVDAPADYVRRSPGKLPEAVRDAACTLHTIVLRIDDRKPARPPAISNHGIHYRVPYLAQLAIYELADTVDVDLTKVMGQTFDWKLGMDQTFNWRLRQVVPIWALGAGSEVRTLDVVPTLFGKSSLQVGFGDSGAVSHISVADVGPIANLSNTVSGAVQASGSGSGSPPPAAGGAAPPAAAPAGSGASQDPVLAPLQMEAAVKKVQADIATYDKAIRDSQTDSPPPKQEGSKQQGG
jgi:hypothetical protein